MRSNVQVADHPLHPMLVPIAIGAFVTAFIFDIAAVATGSDMWFEASFWSLVVGVCAGAVSAITGLYDYLTLRMHDEARKTATTHLVLNVVLMLLFVISLIMKNEYVGNEGSVPSGRILSTFVLDLIATTLLVVSGWYGGEIVYRHGVAVPDEAMSSARTRPGTTPAMGTLGGERPADKDNPDPDF